MSAEQLYQKILTAGESKARTAALFTTKDRYRKQIRAKWTTYYINKGKGVSQSENLALLEDEYIDACEAAEKAEEDAGVAAVQFEAARAWIAAWQTMKATEREEMKIQGRLP